jgi:hypothetical protein
VGGERVRKALSVFFIIIYMISMTQALAEKIEIPSNNGTIVITLPSNNSTLIGSGWKTEPYGGGIKGFLRSIWDILSNAGTIINILMSLFTNVLYVARLYLGLFAYLIPLFLISLMVAGRFGTLMNLIIKVGEWVINLLAAIKKIIWDLLPV